MHIKNTLRCSLRVKLVVLFIKRSIQVSFSQLDNPFNPQCGFHMLHFDENYKSNEHRSKQKSTFRLQLIWPILPDLPVSWASIEFDFHLY